MSLDAEVQGPTVPVFYSLPWHWLILQSEKYGKTHHFPGSVCFPLKTKWAILQHLKCHCECSSSQWFCSALGFPKKRLASYSILTVVENFTIWQLWNPWGPSHRSCSKLFRNICLIYGVGVAEQGTKVGKETSSRSLFLCQEGPVVLSQSSTSPGVREGWERWSRRVKVRKTS